MDIQNARILYSLQMVIIALTLSTPIREHRSILVKCSIKLHDKVSNALLRCLGRRSTSYFWTWSLHASSARICCSISSMAASHSLSLDSLSEDRRCVVAGLEAWRLAVGSPLCRQSWCPAMTSSKVKVRPHKINVSFRFVLCCLHVYFGTILLAFPLRFL